MAKGGFRGGMPMGGMHQMQMRKQAQKMQQDLLKMQQEMEEKQYEATAGGGVITAVVSGKRELVRVTIDPEAVDPDDVEMLQDMVVAAVNEAMRKAEADSAQNMSKLTAVSIWAVCSDEDVSGRFGAAQRTVCAPARYRKQDGAKARVSGAVHAAGAGAGVCRCDSGRKALDPHVPSVPESDGRRDVPHLRG